MKKFKFIIEFEIKTNPKAIYPYLATPEGLRGWFAEEVQILPNKTFNIIWDGVDHLAKITSCRTNEHIKYLFQKNGHISKDTNYLEFKINFSQITQSTFVSVTDCSEMMDLDDLHILWQQLFTKLKKVTGSKILPKT